VHQELIHRDESRRGANVRLPLGICTLGCIVGGLISGVWAPVARADFGAPVHDVDGTCVRATSQIGTTKLFPAGSGTDVVMRLALGAQSVSWSLLGGPFRPGEAASVSLPCSLAQPYRITLYLRPPAPVTFSGVGGSSTRNRAGGGLYFTVPAAGQYVADASVAVAGLQLVKPDGSATTVLSTQTVPLGSLAAGPASMSAVDLPGPASIWSITVRPLPVAITVTGGARRQSIRRGGIAKVSYDLTGDARVTAVVTTRAGARIRALLVDSPVPKGRNLVRWDGLKANGRRAADGLYSITLTTVDLSGTSRTLRSSVILDTTAPRLALARRRLGQGQPLRISIRDRLLGVKSRSIFVDGRNVTKAARRVRTGVVSYLPRGGWSSGSHTVRVRAVDAIGNARTKEFVVRVS
jgi:FlgD Ig-like domain